MAREYPWAVVDGNQSSPGGDTPESVHMTLAAAFAAAVRHNGENPNYHYHVVRWHATRTARHHHLDGVYVRAPRRGDTCPAGPREESAHAR